MTVVNLLRWLVSPICDEAGKISYARIIGVAATVVFLKTYHETPAIQVDPFAASIIASIILGPYITTKIGPQMLTILQKIVELQYARLNKKES